MEFAVNFGERTNAIQVQLTMQSQKEIEVVISALQKKVAEQPGNDKEMELHVIAEKILMRLNSFKTVFE